MKIFSCDFETTTDENDCRVWSYGCSEIGNIKNFIYGNNIDDFMKWCQDKKEDYRLYFHNLKFDGEFILYWLLKNGFTWIASKKEKKSKTFTTLISDMGIFYSITIYFEVLKSRENKVEIWDSQKLVNSSVKEIAENWKLPILKGEIDYNEYRSKNHKITEKELSYLKNDCEIINLVLSELFNEGLTKMTIGSNALSSYKKNFKTFHKIFPKIPKIIDENLRIAYKGGFTYLNPIYKSKLIEQPIACFDVNSLYPSVMYYEKLPIGVPIFFKGKYEKNSSYPLFIQHISCIFEVKENKIPTIQIKKNLRFVENEYLENSKGDIVHLYLTNYDLKLFLEHYNTEDLKYIDGFMFQSSHDLFKNYIEKWKNKKDVGKKENNISKSNIAKLMLNSCYGKFAESLTVRSKEPYLNEQDIVKYRLTEPEENDGVYLPIAIFITAYARYKTITTSQKIKEYSIKKYGYDAYIYSDTDSIYTTLTNVDELKQFIEIDKFKLGAWDFESLYEKGKFLRQKCYICQYHNENNDLCIKTTIAGLPKKLSNQVNFDNFNENFKVDGKLTFKHVKGGVVLVPTTFSIKT